MEINFVRRRNFVPSSDSIANFKSPNQLLLQTLTIRSVQRASITGHLLKRLLRDLGPTLSTIPPLLHLNLDSIKIPTFKPHLSNSTRSPHSIFKPPQRPSRFSKLRRLIISLVLIPNPSLCSIFKVQRQSLN